MRILLCVAPSQHERCVVLIDGFEDAGVPCGWVSWLVDGFCDKKLVCGVGGWVL